MFQKSLQGVIATLDLQETLFSVVTAALMLECVSYQTKMVVLGGSSSLHQAEVDKKKTWKMPWKNGRRLQVCSLFEADFHSLKRISAG